tara:strand:- start:2549 stop:2821 length:273 start_codon:yes stop_codon:yes gene_type:complete
MSYTPQINDYVKWHHAGHIDEGWVYFVGEEYITIEVRVKPKTDNLVSMHKKVHVLVLCHNWFWHELEYVKTRSNVSEDTYKSQEHRPIDP